jgi:hypothetical protein
VDTSMSQPSDDEITMLINSPSDLETHPVMQLSPPKSSISFTSHLPISSVAHGVSIMQSSCSAETSIYHQPNPAGLWQLQQHQLLNQSFHPTSLTLDIHDRKHSNHLQQHVQQQLQLGFSDLNPSTHNLIPFHLQASNANLIANLYGTPGYPPALIPHQLQQHQQQIVYNPPFATNHIASISPQSTINYTVQDRLLEQPIFNGVNPGYPGLRMLHTNPPIFCVDNFLTDLECNFLIEHAQDSFGPAPVVGKGAGEVSPSRTSSTCYLAREAN